MTAPYGLGHAVLQYLMLTARSCPSRVSVAGRRTAESNGTANMIAPVVVHSAVCAGDRTLPGQSPPTRASVPAFGGGVAAVALVVDGGRRRRRPMLSNLRLHDRRNNLMPILVSSRHRHCRRSARLDFASARFGLWLVKKTVNFDNHLPYHFITGNERGTLLGRSDDVSALPARRGGKAWRWPGDRDRRSRCRLACSTAGAPTWRARHRGQRHRAALAEAAIVFADPSGPDSSSLIATARDDCAPSPTVRR